MNGQESPSSTGAKQKKERALVILVMAIVALGAVGVAVCLLLSEFLYPEIEELFACPAWYQATLYASFAIAVGGICGCFFIRNQQNTTKLEFNIELALFLIGLAIEIFCALARVESRALDICICIGGAISSVGFFCGIGGLIGRLRRPRGTHENV